MIYIPIVQYTDLDLEILGVFTSKLLAMYSLRDYNESINEGEDGYFEIQTVEDPDTGVFSVFRKDKGYIYSSKTLLYRYKLCCYDDKPLNHGKDEYSDVIQELKGLFSNKQC